MSDAGRPPDLTDLNSVYASRLKNLQDALNKEGIVNNVISGYRTPEYQGQMYQNHLDRQAGRPLTYPGVEAPRVVAPAWRSFHNYGLAGDFNLPGGQYARLRQLAPQFGLSGIGASDPGHIQLAGTLDQDIKQYNLANWRPDSRPAPTQGGATYAAPPPPSQGLLRRGTSLTTNPITNPGPMDPSAQAHGSTVNPAIPDATGETTPGETTPPPDFWTKLNTPGQSTTDEKGNEVKGKTPLEKITGGLEEMSGKKGDQQKAAPEPAQFAPPQDPMAQMAGPAAQLYSTVQALAAKPLSWGTRPYGWEAGPQIPGMTLNSAGYG